MLAAKGRRSVLTQGSSIPRKRASFFSTGGASLPPLRTSPASSLHWSPTRPGARPRLRPALCPSEQVYLKYFSQGLGLPSRSSLAPTPPSLQKPFPPHSLQGQQEWTSSGKSSSSHRRRAGPSLPSLF